MKKPKQPRSGMPGPLGAAIEEWFSRHDLTPDGSGHRWGLEQRGVRCLLAGARYAGTPGQWWPLPSEVRPCCIPLQEKLKAAFSWPMTEGLLRHCRSYEHVAALHGVDANELRRTIRARRLTMVLARGASDVPF